MADISIGVKIPIDEIDIDQGKVVKMITKFAKCSEKLGASPSDIGAAISLLQDHYYECFGAIPVSDGIVEAIKDTKFLVAKED